MLPIPRIYQAMELREYLRLSSPNCNNTMLNTLLNVPYCLETLDSFSAMPQVFFPAKRFVCEVCDESFKSKQGLNQHIGKMHLSPEDGVTCAICEKEFKHKYALKFHTKQVHEKSTRAECQLCQKSFYNKYELKKHLKKRH